MDNELRNLTNWLLTCMTMIHVAPVQQEVPLGVPDVLICSVGPEIFFEKPGSYGAEPQPDKKWTQLLDQGWNREAALTAAAQFSELKPQVSLTQCCQSHMSCRT